MDFKNLAKIFSPKNNNVLSFLLLFAIAPLVSSQYHLSNWFCLDDVGNFTADSSYESNLNVLLAKLTNQASLASFGNSSLGEGTEKVYMIYNCRGDLNLEQCHECVKEAAQTITKECPVQKEAIMWYQECMVRYANRTIFSVREKSPRSWDLSSRNETNPQLTQVVADNLNNLIGLAAYNLSNRGYVTGEDDDVYFLVQCTPDILGWECERCLLAAFSSMAGCCGTTRSSMMFFLPSCHIRYDRASFTLLDVVASSPNSSELQPVTGRRLKPTIIAAIAVSASVGLGLLLVVLWLFVLKKTIIEKIGLPFTGSPQLLHTVKSNGGDDLQDTKLTRYDFATLKDATRQFANDNIIGKGGFGAVYKGTLKCGQLVAIKRLSDISRQGAKEFINEAHLVGKLQHKNLVRLLGFCSEQKEKLLVYEFLPNSSLDHVLFDPMSQPFIEWGARYEILIGIGRGLQYLHEDSRLTIVHRDLKPGNILLDKAMVPKIADFGTAKRFEEEQKLGNTSRIIGTHGYMAPEYLLMGEYSEKSDVYSFGVMILEIVSGKKNINFYKSSQKENLLGHAWRLWNEDRSFELLDVALHDSCSRDEVMRSIEIGMLCIQGNAASRPTMGEVVLMFTGSVALPFPSMPTMPDCDSETSDDNNDDQEQKDHNQTMTKSITS